ncbi:MAG: hypothetical protein ACFNYQ_12980, partial [Treponema sp.]|uniref:hypothetical protein n=1 Tax=Treponema sp. TaxID=166 RepID=UPI003608A7AD
KYTYWLISAHIDVSKSTVKIRPTPPWSRAEGSDRSGARTPRVSKRRKGGSQMGFVRSKNKPMKLLQI